MDALRSLEQFSCVTYILATCSTLNLCCTSMARTNTRRAQISSSYIWLGEELIFTRCKAIVSKPIWIGSETTFLSTDFLSSDILNTERRIAHKLCLFVISIVDHSLFSSDSTLGVFTASFRCMRCINLEQKLLKCK